jgi:phospholipid/cholesterol/gamma-HCH transport system substrate-binding protein
MTRLRRSAAAVLACLLLAPAVAACSTTASDLPLPGSRLPGETYRLDAEFADALNLAVGAPVKSGGVLVGRVRDITVRDFRARVVMDVLEERRLREGTTVRLRSTTPLGELFVDVDEPDVDGTGDDAPLLAPGSTLPAGDASSAPTIEDTMSAASLLVNGGGLGQVQTIVEEANAALGGREPAVRQALGRMARTAASLNASDDELERALTALARVSTVLDERQDVVDAALTDLRPAARVVRENTDELVGLLQGIDRLGVQVVDVVDRSRADLTGVLAQAGPIFEELNTTADSFRPGLRTLVGFARLIDEAVPAEYLNTYLYFQTSVSLGLPSLPGVGDPGLPRLETPALGKGGLDDVLPLPGVQDLLGNLAGGGGTSNQAPGLGGLGLDGLLGGAR